MASTTVSIPDVVSAINEQPDPPVAKLRAHLYLETIREATRKACVSCGQEPAMAAASFSPKQEHAERLGWDNATDKRIVVPLCEKCSLRADDDSIYSLAIEKAIIDVAADRGFSQKISL